MLTALNYTYWKWDAALSSEFCNLILEQTDWSKSEPAFLTTEKVLDVSYRSTDIIFQDKMQPLGCITRAYMEEANKATGWNYVLDGYMETQIARYKSSDNGHYSWHIDTDPPTDGIQRKLTCVILLNDTSKFEGGQLQLKGMEDQVLLEKQGSIIVFPAFLEHRVTPVTKGVRHTAVTWAVGPSFK